MLFPRNPVVAFLEKTRRTILEQMDEKRITVDARRLTDVNLLKRHILKRCIYGVDLNPMAVELAKVSLWLDCFTLGAPLSFLDHHLRCGNSLIGVTVAEVQDALKKQKGLFGLDWTGLLLATDMMRQIGEMPDITSDQVHESRAAYRRATDALWPFKRILDIYTSRWFGNEPTTTGRGKKRQVEDHAVDFLNSPEAKAFLEAVEREAESQALPRDHPDVIQTALSKLDDSNPQLVATALEAAEEKRFFHGELEFPEVFYGPREGSTQAIERVEGAGFDAVVGNPPYDVLAEKELGHDISQEQSFFRAAPLYAPTLHGKNNLYKLFICRGVHIMGIKGVSSFIVPMMLLGDVQSAGVRQLLLQRTKLASIQAFPQKEDPTRRVFPEAKLATAVFVAHANGGHDAFVVRTNPAQFADDASPSVALRPEDLLRFDPENAVIPSCTQRDWDIAVRIISHPNVRRLGEYCVAYQGEVNETTDGTKGYISRDPKEGPQILRGSNLCMYLLRGASQGEAIFLREREYLDGKPNSLKARHHEQGRVGWQESCPQNNFRRIIAAKIPKERYCNHKINYIPRGDSQLPLHLVLALLNSKLSD